MANPVQPLDFESIISYALGDVWIFVYVALIAFSIFAAKVRMPINAYLMLMLVFALIIYYTVKWMAVVIIMIMVAIAIGFIVVKAIKQ